MSGHRRSAGRALLLLMGTLTASAGVAPGQAEGPPGVGGAPFVSTEPPLADGLGVRDAVDPPTPVVAIRVRVPSTAAPGKDLEYRLLVENSSRAAAHHVVVRVPVPTATRYVSAKPESGTPAASGSLSWQLGTLEGGARREVILTLAPTGAEDIVLCARVSFEHGECVRTRMAKPALQVRKTGPERALLHDVMKFAVEITNNGQAEAADVVLIDDLPPGLDFLNSTSATTGNVPLTFKLGTLGPGQRRRVEYEVISQKIGTFENKVVVTAAGGLRQEASRKVVVGEPKLVLVKTGPKRRSLDRPAAYQLTVSNPGSMAATNVQLADELFYDEKARTGLEFVGASDGGRAVGNDVRWSLGTLAPGARRTVNLSLRARQAGTFANVASVKADRDLSARASATTEFETPTGLTLDVEKSDDPVAVGKTTTFTFRVRQRGGAAASKVGLSVTLPEELKVTDARGPSAGSQDRQTVTFALLGLLEPGVDAVYVVTAQARTAAEVKVRAEANTDPPPAGGPVQREESMLIVAETANGATPARDR